MSTRTRDPKPTTPPTWEEYWVTVGNENFRFARELIELSSSVRAHFAHFIDWHDEPEYVDDPNATHSWEPSIPDPEGWVRRDANLDWRAAAKAADEWPASSTEQRLLDLVLAFVQPEEEWDPDFQRTANTRLIDVRTLGLMGSWRDDVAAILNRYITGQEPKDWRPPQERR